MKAEQIISDNESREAKLAVVYDPVSGAGSPFPRREVLWDEGILHLPVRMFEVDDDLAGVLRFCAKHGTSVRSYVEGKMGLEWDGFEVVFNRYRIVHDYEFWCVACVKIEDRYTQKLIPFKLKLIQARSFAGREKDRLDRLPVRQVELKHRQYGSTTEKNAYICWLQNVVLKGGHAWLISLMKGAAAEIQRRYDLISTHYPSWAGSITMKGIRGTLTTRKIVETTGMIGIASVNNPQGPTGYTAHFGLISEAGKMASSTVQSAERLITNFTSTMPQDADTVLMVESTAEQTGAWFKRTVEEAIKGESSYQFHFTTFTEDPDCRLDENKSKHVRRAGSIETWIGGWLSSDADPVSRKLKELWEWGLSLSQIIWYEAEAREKPTLEDMMQENPLTPEEAFQYGERRVFMPKYVAGLRPTCKPPMALGEMVPANVENGIPKAPFDFEKALGGALSVWCYPGSNYYKKLDTSRRIAYRYIGAADVGGMWKEADYSVCTILDRAPRLFDERPEIVAEWHGHVDIDEFAWICVMLCTWYENALFVPESNKWESNPTHSEIAPDSTYTVLDIVRENYRNVYVRRSSADSSYDERVEKVGFHMNVKTKGEVIDALKVWLRGDGQPLYVERSSSAANEMDSYLYHPKGGTMVMAAAGNKKDDRVITRAILAKVDQETPPCVIVEDHAPRRRAGGYAGV